MSTSHPGKTVYILLKGSVRVVAEGHEKDVTLAVLGPSEVVGEMSILDNGGHSATVLTREDCQFLCVSRTAFLEQLWKIDPIPLNMSRILSRRLRRCAAQIHALATLDVNGRIAKEFLILAREYGQPAENDGTLIPLRLRQSDIAEMVGASRVRVNQILSSWKLCNYISIGTDSYVTLLNPAALERYTR